MKKILLAVLISFFSTFAIAAESVIPPSALEKDIGSSKAVRPRATARPHPCAMIERICKEAHFKEFISRDCVVPILKGKPVGGVNTEDISNQQLKACRMEKNLLHY